jgi:hypothetical protein
VLTLLGMLILAGPPLPDGNQALTIDRASIDAKGVLALDCSLTFPTSQRLYSWRGSLQPAVGQIVFVEVRDEHDQKIDVKLVPGPLPEFPHPRDVVAGTNITYAKPLRLIAAHPGAKLSGCFRVRVFYDSSRLETEYRDRAHLDPLDLQSDFVEVCSTETPPGSKKIAITGTVTSIFCLRNDVFSLKNWGVTLHVDKVKLGKYTEPEFTFAIHSPARSGLKAGHRYTIEATWDGHEYHVDEPVLMKEEPVKGKPSRADQR